ncbi:putative CoA ligase CCL6 [Drosera capensis]
MLGRRKITDGKAGPYVWLTYQEVYDSAIQIGSAIRECCVIPGDHYGIFGSNCPELIIVMEGCNSQAITYIPLYDTLGKNAIESIINHAEVSIAFVQENKLRASAIVSFGNITVEQKKEAEEFGVSCVSWEEFSQLIKDSFGGRFFLEVPLCPDTLRNSSGLLLVVYWHRVMV